MYILGECVNFSMVNSTFTCASSLIFSHLFGKLVSFIFPLSLVFSTDPTLLTHFLDPLSALSTLLSLLHPLPHSHNYCPNSVASTSQSHLHTCFKMLTSWPFFIRTPQVLTVSPTATPALDTVDSPLLCKVSLPSASFISPSPGSPLPTCHPVQPPFLAPPPLLLSFPQTLLLPSVWGQLPFHLRSHSLTDT